MVSKMQIDDLSVIEMMEQHGGSFVKALASAFRVADPENRDLIRATWPDYWAKYVGMVRICERCGCDDLDRCHHIGDMYLPEGTWYRCANCGFETEPC